MAKQDPSTITVAVTRHTRDLPTPAEALDWYRNLVEGFDQALPMLVIGSEQGTISMPLDYDERVPVGVRRGAGMARARKHALTWLLVSAEAWHRVFDGPDEAGVADHLRHGDLEQAHALGDTRVQEVVSLWGLRKDLTGYNALVPFARTPGGVTWQPMAVIDLGTDDGATATGEILEAMVSALVPRAN